MDDQARRLIEDAFPVRAISYQSTREKLLRKRDYHLSMLHLWWARRPLAAARAAVFATLVPADAWALDPAGLAEYFTLLTAWGGDYGVPEGPVADARRRILAANDGQPPKVLDCFAGGGAIPLEVARLGGRATAVELNPVAYLILRCVLDFPQRYGASLAADVERWGAWVRAEAWAAVGDLYPGIPAASDSATHVQLGFDGAPAPVKNLLTPVAYLWTRTVPCPNPSTPEHRLHLVRQTWLVKKPGGKKTAGRYVALRPVVHRATYSVSYEVVTATSPEELGFDPEDGSERGDASCRVCGATVTAKDVKRLGRSGAIDYALMAVVAVAPRGRGKHYFGSDDAEAFERNTTDRDRLLDVLQGTSLSVPTLRLPTDDSLNFKVPLYGYETVGSLFTYRQLATLLTLCHKVRRGHEAMLAEGMDPERARAVATYLGMAIDRVADRGSTLCHWDNSAEKTANTFARQALPMVWDFSESNPFGPSSGSFGVAVEQVAKVVRHCAGAGAPATVIRGSATDPTPGAPFDAVITDPPYYDNISYADLSDFFYAWLQRSIGHLWPEHLAGPTTPKKKEIVAVPYRHHGDRAAAMQAYDDMMAEVFTRRREELKPGAPLVVVYAHKTYEGWSTLINALRRAGFVVSEAWPLDTEMPTRSVGQGTASLASSIFLVARRREDDRVGDWVADVLPDLREIVAQRVRELPAMGVVGDDLVIAAIGAGLRAYTQYASVQLPNGDDLAPVAYLRETQREVVEVILADVFGLERSGIRAVDEATQMYIMGRFEFGPAWVDFDRANTLARALGVELAGPRSALKGARALLEQDKGKIRLRDYNARGPEESLGRRGDAGALAPVIDVLHRLLWLSEHHPLEVRDFLLNSGVDQEALRMVAQALAGDALSRKGAGTSGREQQAVATLLGSWKRLVDENLLWVRA
jgi:putative DNA methylase